MRVAIATRKCDVPEAVMVRTNEQVEKLVRFDRRLASAEVVFRVEGHVKRAEGILSVDGDEPVIAHGEGQDFRLALDQMVDRLGKILRRRRSHLTEHKAQKLSDLASPEP